MSTRGLLISGLLLIPGVMAAQEAWDTVLSRMPLTNSVAFLNHTNCAETLLPSLQSNATVKALIFMPGATDELYFFRRVAVTVTNPNPSLLDAITALTNQSPLRVTFRPPFVLLHSAEDVLVLDITIKHERTQKKLMTGKPLPHLMAVDRDWTQLLQLIKKKTPASLLPYAGTKESWHFYRHTLSGWNLTPWEVMEAAALAGKTKFTVIRSGVVFSVDPRVGAVPQLEKFPGH